MSWLLPGLPTRRGVSRISSRGQTPSRPFPSSPSSSLFAYPSISLPYPGGWAEPVDGVRWYYPGYFFGIFDTLFGTFWCIFATNLRPSSFHFRKQFLSALTGVVATGHCQLASGAATVIFHNATTFQYWRLCNVCRGGCTLGEAGARAPRFTCCPPDSKASWPFWRDFPKCSKIQILPRGVGASSAPLAPWLMGRGSLPPPKNPSPFSVLVSTGLKA